MNKKITILLIVFFSLLLSTIVEAKMTVDFKQDDLDFKQYKELYVQNIDLRGMTFGVYDDEEDEFDPEPLDDKKLNDLALELYDYFFVQLKDVIKINESQDIDESKKALIMNMKLSGYFQYEDRGMLINYISKDKSIETTLFFECEMIDAKSKEVLFIIKDEHVIKSPVPDQPLSQQEELDDLSNIFRVWSTRFSKVIQQMKTDQKIVE